MGKEGLMSGLKKWRPFLIGSCILLAGIRFAYPDVYFFQKRTIFTPQIGGYCEPDESIRDALGQTQISGDGMEHLRFLESEFFLSARYFAVSVVDPVSGFSFHWNQDIPFHAASTYKAPVLAATYYLGQQRPALMGKRLYVHNSFRSIYDFSIYEIPGVKESVGRAGNYLYRKKSVSFLLEQMSRYSDNLATNLVVDAITVDSYNKVLAGWGMGGLKIRRGVYDITAHRNCIDNQITSDSLVEFYRFVYTGQKLHPSTRRKIMKILTSTYHRERLPALLPKNVKVANKPGRIETVNHDAGIIFPPDGKPYYIAILTGFYSDLEKSNESIAKTSLYFYEKVLEHRKQHRKK